MSGSRLYIVFHQRMDGLTFCGVFQTPEAAERECLTADHCVCPAELGTAIHRQQPIEWEGAYFPKRGEKPELPCNHEKLNRDAWGGLVCEKCNEALDGWYCPTSPNHRCEYPDGDEWCVHCGEPEERK